MPSGAVLWKNPAPAYIQNNHSILQFSRPAKLIQLLFKKEKIGNI